MIDALIGPRRIDSRRWRHVLRRDPCSYCLRQHAGTVDHVRPRHGGGPNVTGNLTGACSTCNQRKDAGPLLLFLLQDGFPVQLKARSRRSLVTGAPSTPASRRSAPAA